MTTTPLQILHPLLQTANNIVSFITYYQQLSTKRVHHLHVDMLLPSLITGLLYILVTMQVGGEGLGNLIMPVTSGRQRVGT